MAEIIFALFGLGLVTAGFVGSFVPMVPAPALSIGGVLLYWAGTRFTEPSIALLLFTLVAGGFALLFDAVAGAVGAKAGGARPTTIGGAALAGVISFLYMGPVGAVVAGAVTVFGIEFYHSQEAGQGMRAAVYATAGMVASTGVQAAVTAAIFLWYLFAVIL